MATTKKTSVKKKPATKKSASAKATSSKSKRPVFVQSFRPMANDTPFLTFRLTKQTLYWLVLSVVVLFFGLWIVKMQLQIEDIYNSIEFNDATIDTSQLPAIHHTK